MQSVFCLLMKNARDASQIHRRQNFLAILTAFSSLDLAMGGNWEEMSFCSSM